MAPVAVDTSGRMLNGYHDKKIDTMNPHDLVQFDKSLTPKKYEIQGTDPNSKVLFTNVNIIDSTGADAFNGDVYIEGKLSCQTLCFILMLTVSQHNGSNMLAKFQTRKN